MNNLKPNQAICIKAFDIPGIRFKVGLLEIVTFQSIFPESYESYYIWVKNSEGWVWYFRRNEKMKSDMLFFNDYFKTLE